MHTGLIITALHCEPDGTSKQPPSFRPKALAKLQAL